MGLAVGLAVGLLVGLEVGLLLVGLGFVVLDGLASGVAVAALYVGLASGMAVAGLLSVGLACGVGV